LQREELSITKKTTSPMGLAVGTTLPDFHVGASNVLVSLHSLISSHLLLLLVSTSCEPCLTTLEAIDELTEIYRDVNAVLLIDGPESSCEFVRNALKDRVQVFRYFVPDMIEKLRTSSLPYGYVVSQTGTILSSRIVNSYESLLTACAPISSLIGGFHENSAAEC